MQIGVFEAKNQFSQLVAQAEAGQSTTVTRHGEAVACIVPATARRGAAVDGWLRRRPQVVLNPKGRARLSIRQLIEEGRR